MASKEIRNGRKSTGLEGHGTATGTGAGNVLELKIIAQGSQRRGLAGNQGISDGEPVR